MADDELTFKARTHVTEVVQGPTIAIDIAGWPEEEIAALERSLAEGLRQEREFIEEMFGLTEEEAREHIRQRVRRELERTHTLIAFDGGDDG